MQNLFDLDLHLYIPILDKHTGDPQDLFEGMVNRSLHENGCELAVLEKLLIEQVVRMQTDLLAADQNDLS